MLTLFVVSRGEQNKNWAKYTPNGSIQMTIKNPGPAGLACAPVGQGSLGGLDRSAAVAAGSPVSGRRLCCG